MTQCGQERFSLSKEAVDLLVWSVPNEVINGFEVSRFEQVIGTSKDQVKTLANRLRSIPGNEHVAIDRSEARVLSNALAVVLEELGEQEFFTRTGCDFENGQTILHQLEEFLRVLDRN